MAEGRERAEERNEGGTAALEAGLAEALPGFAVLDRRLELGGACADLVGVEAGGRLVLVLLQREASGDVVLTALDLAAEGRAQVGLLSRHLGSDRLRPDLAPMVVIAAERFDERVIDRLAPLSPDSVRLFEVREIESAQRSSTFLVPPTGAVPPAAEPDTEEFLLGLGAGLSELVETLVVRLERMDADVVLARGSEGLEWTWRGRELCRVLAREGLLEGWLADREPRPIGSEQDLERFVEAALVRWVQLTEELEGLGEVELVPAGPRPLLSAEELDLLSN